MFRCDKEVSQLQSGVVVKNDSRLEKDRTGASAECVDGDRRRSAG